MSGRNLKANLERQVQSFVVELFLLELLRSLCGMLSRRALGRGGSRGCPIAVAKTYTKQGTHKPSHGIIEAPESSPNAVRKAYTTASLHNTHYPK